MVVIADAKTEALAQLKNKAPITRAEKRRRLRLPKAI